MGWGVRCTIVLISVLQHPSLGVDPAENMFLGGLCTARTAVEPLRRSVVRRLMTVCCCCCCCCCCCRCCCYCPALSTRAH
uniref:Putative secreted protein n=1 Tax=Anopheles darlingi TaxID=43151 RepID=A0A2M4DLI9_ANODA